MRQWQVVLFSMVLSALGMLPSVASAQFCTGANPQQMPVEVASQEEGFRRFRMGCAGGNQIQTLLDRVNASIRNPRDHVTMDHFIDSNLRDIGYMCRMGHGNRQHMIHNRRFGMSIQDYSDRYCQEGEAKPYVIPGTVMRIPATGIKTPTQVVREITAELNARDSLDQAFIASVFDRLDVQERRTDATPITRDARLGLTAALRAKLPTLVGSVSSGSAPVATIPHSAASNAVGAAHIVYQTGSHDRYLIPFWVMAALSCTMLFAFLLQRHKYQRLSFAPTMVPSMADDESEEKIKRLQKDLIEANRRADKASADLAKAKTESKSKSPKIDPALAEKAALYDQFVDAWNNVRDQLTKLGMGRGTKEFLQDGTTGFMLMLGKCQDLMVREGDLKVAKKQAEDERDTAVEALKMLNPIKAVVDTYYRTEGRILTAEMLQRQLDVLQELRLNHQRALNHAEREVAARAGVTVPPPAATVIGLPPVQTGDTRTGLPALLSSIPAPPLPREFFGSPEAEIEQLRGQIETLSDQVTSLQSACEQYHGIMVELLRSMGGNVDDIPRFELLKVDQPSEVVQKLYGDIMAAYDKLESENSRLTSKLAETEQSLESAKSEATQARAEALDQESAKNEKQAELTRIRAELQAKLNTIGKMQVSIKDVETKLNQAEAIRRGLLFAKGELSEDITRVRAENEELQKQFVLAENKNAYFERFCESIGGESMLEIVGLAEVIHREFLDRDITRKADSQRLLDAMNTLFTRIVNLPHEAIKAVREHSGGPVVVVPAFAAGLAPTGTE